ncbi:tellurite resistance TerB family protein [Vibrio gallicus]|uniref:tellurite resistance TerB family protein n=1 Tax=Vibrio gallicus TaxID=190897 RepID=UPI0021C4312A|nr:TerB family tellurite resistance protein [Vibrio gallicus]
MFNKIQSLFKELLEGQDLASHAKTEPKLAMAALLCEVSKADHTLTDEEAQAELSMLKSLLEIESEEARLLLQQARDKSEQSASLYDFTSQLRELAPSERFNLIKSMWVVAFADGVLDPIEESIIRKVSELIYLDHHEFIRAKLEASPK